MAQNIFEQYGIKEVADVQFEALDKDERLGVKAGDIVLYLDTLKVSTIETTADSVDATGGKGNVALVSWDYGREVTLNLTDALFTPASLAVMMGGKGVSATTGAPITIRYTQDIASYSAGVALDHVPVSEKIYFIDFTNGTRGNVAQANTFSSDTVSTGDKVKLFYDVQAGADNTEAYQITIDSANFPGTYKVYGDTVVRNADGHDTAFQFVIPKAKINSEVTFTMEAEGDPTTFDMTLKVLRSDNKEMFKLIKYDLNVSGDSTSDTAKIMVYFSNPDGLIVNSMEVADGATIAKNTEIKDSYNSKTTYYVAADTTIDAATDKNGKTIALVAKPVE